MYIYSSKRVFEYPENVNVADIDQRYIRYVPKTLQQYVTWLDVYKYSRETNIKIYLKFNGVTYGWTCGFDNVSEMKFYLSILLKDYRSGKLEQDINNAISEGKSEFFVSI